MTDMDQDQRVEERCPNDRFPIRKRPLRVAPTNDRYWPESAVGAAETVLTGLSTSETVCRIGQRFIRAPLSLPRGTACWAKVCQSRVLQRKSRPSLGAGSEQPQIYPEATQWDDLRAQPYAHPLARARARRGPNMPSSLSTRVQRARVYHPGRTPPPFALWALESSSLQRAGGYVRFRSDYVRFAPESGHRRRKNASDSKSGHWMSAYPPIADVNGHVAGGPLLTRSGSQRPRVATHLN